VHRIVNHCPVAWNGQSQCGKDVGGPKGHDQCSRKPLAAIALEYRKFKQTALAPQL
jgi:hypothetical protein